MVRPSQTPLDTSGGGGKGGEAVEPDGMMVKPVQHRSDTGVCPPSSPSLTYHGSHDG